MKILNMKKITHCLKIAIISAVLLLPVKYGFAQEQSIRVGSAGASELLINPFGRSSGWGSANIAGVTGLEGQYSNVAGLASTEKTLMSGFVSSVQNKKATSTTFTGFFTNTDCPQNWHTSQSSNPVSIPEQIPAVL